MTKHKTCQQSPTETPATPAVGQIQKPVLRFASHKIQDIHRLKWAIVYVRQSSPHQVMVHVESKARQYALAEYAAALGWPPERILVIDEDQGISGKTADGRPGFQRLVAEVTMNHVGLVLGLEISRLARSSQDWHHLFELCGLYGALLADEDGVYDANDPNDRLLLGLKGIISEVELHTMRARLQRGSLNKAQRGELFLHMPIGYVKLPSGEATLDPDEQVRSVTQLIFDKFDELGSASKVFRYLYRQGIRIGVRPKWGPQAGEVQWRRPCRGTILGMLRNPIYAGAYAHGRGYLDPAKKVLRRPRALRCSVDPEKWKVLIRDKLPAYITWERYRANVQRLRDNRASWDAKGAPRKGPALLGGLVQCGHCGSRVSIHYGSKESRGFYGCHRRAYEPDAPRCPAVPAQIVDQLVSQQLLRALEPASLELSVQASQDVQRERDRMQQLWKQRLERAHYETERAARQYDAVEPENRLVARTLEKRWEEAIHRERELQEEHDRSVRESPAQLTNGEKGLIASLSSDIPALWEASSHADRKVIVRHLVECVVVTRQNDSELMDVTIHWTGGYVSQHEVSRRVQRFEQLSQFPALRVRITEMRQAGWTAERIAEQLNQEGFRPPRMRQTFNAANVNALLRKLGLSGLCEHRQTNRALMRPHEWCLLELAQKLKIRPHIMQRWRQRGWVHARRVPGAPKRWFIWADKEELQRLRQLRNCPIDRSQKYGPRFPAKLTTPKKRHDE
ncbi:MAG: recombinase family protein [Verrucomicrobiales bacterium]|nr:recombinase family protein [Verrucomicrobiales bacterium]